MASNVTNEPSPPLAEDFAQMKSQGSAISEIVRLRADLAAARAELGRTRDELRQGERENSLRGHMLSRVNDAVIAIDADYRITYMNAAAERQYGVDTRDFIGRPLGSVYQFSWINPADEQVAAASLAEHGTVHRSRRAPAACSA